MRKTEIVLSGRGRNLDKAIWRHISAVAAPILTKFGRLMQNRMQIMGKSEIGTGNRITIWWTFVFPNQKSLYLSHKLIYICRPLMSTKFGLLIDFDLLKARTSTNTKPEVVLSDCGRYLEKSIWRHISAAADPEWHDNNGDEVKIETEKSDRLKARNFSLVVRACKSRMLFLCKRLRFGRSWTTVYR